MRVEWHGVIYLRDGAASPEAATGESVTWWARVRGNGFLRYEIAGRNKLFDGAPDARVKREAWARKMLGVALDAASGDYLDYDDASSGFYRAALIVDGRIVACLFLSSRPQLLPSREWLANLLSKKRIDDADRRGLLAGRPLTAGGDVGPVVCSCFRVGRKTIVEAIRCHGLKSAAQVGAHLKAGTNCGSCVPEISALVAATVNSKQPEPA
jgi:assimilatory nitrate reductase catalytic subunit